jgi:hypothetical protein
MSESDHPTLEERDEPLSLYGLDLEKMIEAVRRAKPEDEPEPVVSGPRGRRQ